MSSKPRRKGVALAIWALMACMAQAPATAQSAPETAPASAPSATAPTASEPVRASAMGAQLFYEVLLGEINARHGNPGDGFALLLDAARRSGEPQLFQRAAETAIRARAPEAALSAARAWRQAQPDSRDARRLEIQVLIALGRLPETVEPLRAEIASTPLMERQGLLAVLTRTLARAQNKKQAAQVMEQALADELNNPTTASMAWTAVGRLRQMAGDVPGALQAAQQGAALDPSADGPVVLAMDLISDDRPEAEALVKNYLAGTQVLPEARVAYARALVGKQRYDDARAQLLAVTQAHPTLPDPWLMLGSLQGQAQQDALAEASFKRYLELATSQRNADERQRGIAQAYLQLAHLAERRKDYDAAGQWLARVQGADEMFEAQTRRALLLGRQGQVEEARALLSQMPISTTEQKKQRLLTEVQLLREADQAQAAYELMRSAHLAEPDDTDLLYDLALLADKQGRHDEMERHLRTLITQQPDNAHAYNALGYSLAERNTRLDEARALIQKAVALAPEDPFIADSLGWVEYRMGNTAEARRILELAYQKRPDPEIGAHLGEVLWVQGERESALRIWREVQRVDANNNTLKETLQRLRASP